MMREVIRQSVRRIHMMRKALELLEQEVSSVHDHLYTNAYLLDRDLQ
jgi:pyruvate formate-lyase activating enzyme-like uncharacterized protein